MGNLKIRYLSGGKNVLEKPYVFEKVGNAQYFQSKYDTDKMEKITTEGDDFLIHIDLDKIDNEINWSDQVFPNDDIKSQVELILYLRNISNEIKKITEEIQSCRKWERRFHIDRLGRNAFEIISGVKDLPQENWNFNKSHSLANIGHTIGKEVGYISFLKPGDSEKRKREIINQAIDRLISDINFFKFCVDQYELSQD
jgi:hypothetical protein